MSDTPQARATSMTAANSTAAETLGQIGSRAGTDKTLHHNFDFYYPLFLERFRPLRNAAMLEIGIDQGASLKMWLEYFPHAFIYGIDLGVSGEGPRHRILRMDQSDLPALSRLAATEIRHPVFLVVDDGSHIPGHQASSFDLLFRDILLPGGVYIIEDVEVSYWTKGDCYGTPTRLGYQHPASVIEVFKLITDDLNQEFLTEANRHAQDLRLNGRISRATRDLISSVTFARNCIIITKKTAAEQAQPNRQYRFADRL